jgi:hypothetical protein
MSMGAKLNLLQNFPSVLVFAPELGVSSEALAETLLIIGMFTSVVCILGRYNWTHFAILYALYLSLLQTGQSFMSFQWDILLVEVGFLAAVSLTLPFRQYAGPSITKLLFRFIIWKLMFMAGVVKVFANCPTWLNLTALEYHFATQPLAHGLSWFAHQLHPLLLRAGVAITLLIEIPLAFFCVAHFRLVRQVGAIAQVLLQLMIIGTGNYNFFNFLTLLLTIPVWAGDTDVEEIITPSIDTNSIGTDEKQMFFGEGPSAPAAMAAAREKRTVLAIANANANVRKSTTWVNYGIQLALIVNVIAGVGAVMFEIKYLAPSSTARSLPDTSWLAVLGRVQLAYSTNMKNFLPKAVKFAGPIAAAAVLLKGMVLIYSRVKNAPRSKSIYSSSNKMTTAVLDKGVWIYRLGHTLFLVAFLVAYLTVSLEPLSQINSLTLTAVLPTGMKSSVSGYVNKLRPFSISGQSKSGYFIKYQNIVHLYY